MEGFNPIDANETDLDNKLIAGIFLIVNRIILQYMVKGYRQDDKLLNIRVI